MEEDGNYEDFLGRITYNYGDLNEQLSAPVKMYNGSGPILHQGVARCFETILECVQVCGGMDYEFFKRIRANSNQYGRLNMNDLGDFGGSPWTNITVQEMIRFHGVLLKRVWTTENLVAISPTSQSDYLLIYQGRIQLN